MKKSDDVIVNETMPGLDSAGEETTVKKKIAPVAIGFALVAIAAAIIYGVLDYRISQSDARLQMILDNVQEVRGSNVDLKGLENKIVSLYEGLNKKIDEIEVRVTDLEANTVKTADLNVTELIKLKNEIDEKLKILEENRELLERLALLDKEGKLSSAKSEEEQKPKVVMQEVKPAEISQIQAPPKAPLPFTVVGIVEPTVVNVKINGQVYSININKSSIYDRYEIVVVNPAQQTVVVYDTQTNEYYPEKVQANK